MSGDTYRKSRQPVTRISRNGSPVTDRNLTLQPIKRTPNPPTSTIQNVRVDHRRADILVSE